MKPKIFTEHNFFWKAAYLLPFTFTLVEFV